MNRRGPRGLTPEERALWEKVARRTAPMHPDRPEPGPRQIPKNQQPSRANPPLSAFRIGQANTETSLPDNLAAPLSDRLSARPVHMDKKSFGKLKRGRLKPEARIDLHGMTLDQAHGRLNRFILDAHARGLRLVLVITGKGKDRFEDGPIPVRRGVLKHQLPHWLESPALRRAVLQVTEAHARHGGSGAYYVYLRRQRQ